jgi:DNA-binding MarR family transcriptional regulator
VLGDMVATDNEGAALEATGALLREVARLHVKAQRAAVACCGTTVAQCHVLTELGRESPLAMTGLVRRLGLDKGWISRAVAGLVEEGLLARTADAADARVVVVALTAAGRRRVRALNHGLDGQAARVLGRVAAAERAQVHRALELVRGALREELRLVEDTPGGALPAGKVGAACR